MNYHHAPHQEAFHKLGAYCTIAAPLPCNSVEQRFISLFATQEIMINPCNISLEISGNHCVILNDFGVTIVNKREFLLIYSFFASSLNKVSSVGDLIKETSLNKSDISNYIRSGVLLSSDQKPIRKKMYRQRPLTAWISMTEQCNLDCSYCFQPHSPHRISNEIAERIIRDTLASAINHGYQMVAVTYAGGEPLMRLPAILRMHSDFRVLAAASNIDFKANIVTNGVLLSPDVIKQLSDKSIGLIISLDGINNQSDVQRNDKMGRPTVQKVKENICSSIAAGLDPMVAVTITPESLPGLVETTEWLINVGARFCFGLQQCSERSSNQTVNMKSTDVIGFIRKSGA